MPLSNSHQIIQHITNELFIPEQRRLTRDKDALVVQNQEAMGQPVDGFMWQGKFYKLDNQINGVGKRLTLHLSLWNQMEEHIRDRATVAMDRKMIEQTLFSLIYPCSTEQDIRDALPECLVVVAPLPLAQERMRAEAYTIADDARAMRQYEKTIERMEFYSATRLLY